MGFSLKKIAKKAVNVVTAGTVGALTGGNAGAIGATIRQVVRESESGKPTALTARSVGQSAVTGVASSVAASLAVSTVAPVPGAAGALAAKTGALLKTGAGKLGSLIKGGGLVGQLGGLLKRGSGGSVLEGAGGGEFVVPESTDLGPFRAAVERYGGALDIPGLVSGRLYPQSAPPAAVASEIPAAPVVVTTAPASYPTPFNPLWILGGLVLSFGALMLMSRRRLA